QDDRDTAEEPDSGEQAVVDAFVAHPNGDGEHDGEGAAQDQVQLAANPPRHPAHGVPSGHQAAKYSGTQPGSVGIGPTRISPLKNASGHLMPRRPAGSGGGTPSASASSGV